MNKNKKWSKNEERVVFRAVAEQPNNLQKAFLAASKKINRSPKAISLRWYYVLSKDPKKSSCTFVTYGKKALLKNRKISVGKENVITKEASLWYKIYKLLFK